MADEPGGEQLVVLVADVNMEFTLKGLLSRSEALDIEPVTFRVLVHPERDPGCYLRAPEFMRPFRHRYEHALVLFDREGSGRDPLSREALERDLERRLKPDWGEKAAVIAFDPELEIWWWSDSPHVDEVIGWKGRDPELRAWLVEEGFASSLNAKPERPKEAVEKALRLARKPRSSALYRRLAERVSLRRCQDPAFLRFCELLRRWFPRSPNV